ncbi:nucleotidyltransferase domain-containing protein [candidate division KSB1 bacterium]|nr:nucleotidyltransferase domain-containing protein [candidate division KSB1 bacterium]
MNRKQKIQKLRRIAKSVAADNPEVMIIYLYGSLVEGYPHGESDIDLAVVIGKGKSTKDFLRQMTVISEPFEAVFGEARIDLRVVDDTL